MEKYSAKGIYNVLASFPAYLHAGLNDEISPERRTQLDVVSDFLEQAQNLLDNFRGRLAAPVVLIEASL